jgi:PAS domain S-box-containing protein
MGIRDAVRLAALTAAYVAAAELALDVAFVHGRVSPVCLPAGLAIAALTLWGPRLWPAIAVGSIVANFFFAGNPISVATGIAVGDTLEAVLGAMALRRLGVKGEVTRVRDAVAILAVAVLAPLLSATGGALSVTLSGISTWDHYSWVWLVWWLGDSMAALLVLPLLLAWAGARSPVKYPPRPMEFTGAFALAGALLSFEYLKADALAILDEPFLPPSVFLFPPVLWAMLRLRPRETMLVLATASSLSVAYTVAGLKGETIGPLLSLQMELFGVGGGALLLLGAIAERDRAQQAVRESEAQLRATFEQAAVGIGHVSPSGHWLRVNEKFARMLGYSRDELIARHWSEFTPPDDKTFWTDLVASLINNEQDSFQAEKPWLRKDGTPLWAQITASSVRDESGAVRNFSIVCVDMSERQRAEAERQAREAAESANRAKSLFLANMSHELRSPLNTILGFARLVLQRGGLRDEARRDLEIIVRSGEHLLTLINQVLALSQIEAGRATLNETRFDLHELLHDLREMFARRAEEHGLEFMVDSAQVPHFIVSDQVKLRQILINLLSNAVKFTRTGRVGLAARARPQHVAPAGVPVWRLCFAVSDTGPGIARDEVKQLFGPFVQAEAGRQAGEGSGLGLAISRSFVRLMGGELEIESLPGNGTTVWFDVPVREAGEQAAAPARGTRHALALAPGEPRWRILVVDDLAEARELLVRLLRPLGFEVRQAANGLEAVALADRWQPDLVWMDLAMPGLDGLEAVRRIQAQALSPPVIIALTAHAFMEEWPTVLAAGCDDVLHKPFQEDSLLSLLEKHLGAQFIYEEVATEIPPPRLDVAALAALPAETREELARAVDRLDTSAVDRWIQTIRPFNPRVAESVADLAEDFQYERILSYIRAVPPPAVASGSVADHQ